MTDMTILAAGALQLTLAPGVGGAVARFDVDGRPLFRPAPEGFTDVLQAGCFPMAPFVNRVRDGRFVFRGRHVALDPMPGERHPLHGQGWRAPWRVLEAALDRVVLAYNHAAADWPWPYEARQLFELDENGLTVTLSLINLGAEAMPAGLGLHPYFPCNAQTVVDAPVQDVWTIDDEVMPVARVAADGRYSLAQRRICGADLDNGYEGFTGKATIRWPDRGLEVDIVAPGARYFQLYAPAAGELFVAEAVTHANAALNLPEPLAAQAGLKVLDPGGTLALVTRFDIRTAA